MYHAQPNKLLVDSSSTLTKINIMFLLRIFIYDRFIVTFTCQFHLFLLQQERVDDCHFSII